MSEPPVADLSTPRTYAQSKVVRILWPAVCLLLAASTAGAAVLTATGQWAEASDVPFLPWLTMLMAVATLWLLAMSISVNRRIRVDAEGLVQLGLFGSRRIAWGEVRELTLGGSPHFAEGGMGIKLFVEAADGRLITFTNRLRYVGQLIDLIEAKTGRSFAASKGETIESVGSEGEDTPENPAPPEDPGDAVAGR